MATRSPDEVLRILDAWIKQAIDAEIDAEMERVLAMTPEEVEAELRAAGFDVEAPFQIGAVDGEGMDRGDDR